jgi:hypothetical protein
MGRLGFVIAAAAFLGCGKAAPPDLKVGGLYSVKEGDGFQVIKVLAVDRDIVHVRLYKNKFPARPPSVEPAKLSLGSLKDKDGMGIGHAPIDKSMLEEWAPEFIMETAVSEEELEGYRLWKESKGGSFK